MNTKWVQESMGTCMKHSIAMEAVRYEGRTDWQQILIGYNQDLGEFLVLDGQLQSASVDEFIYHECLVQPAMVSHPDPRRVLILGGGEGATLREVLRHPSVERVVMVEIDDQVVKLCQCYLPAYSAGAFQDPRTQLVIGCARAWLENTSERFDVIISDLTEPEEGSLSTRLFSRDFFELAQQRLTAQGVLAVQASCGSFGYHERHCLVARTCRSVFPEVRSMLVGIPSFNTQWAFLMTGRVLSSQQVDQRLRERGLNKVLRFYDGESHQRLMALPLCLRRQLERAGPLLREEQVVSR